MASLEGTKRLRAESRAAEFPGDKPWPWPAGAGGARGDEAGQEQRSEPKKRFVFETVADLRSMPTAEELIGGWIPERSVGLLYGRWGSFKTFIAFDWALHLAFGMKEWHGAKLPGEPCDVLMIAREGHAGFLRRVDAFKARHGLTEDPKNLVFMRKPISFLDDAGFAALKGEITTLGKQFRFAVVDTVGRCLPGADMAKEQPITLFMERLQQIGELTGGASLGVHHENKSGDANGSMYFQNNSDFMFCTSRDGTSLAGTLTCAKQKDGEDGWSKQFKLTKVMFDDGKSSLVVESVSGGEAPTAKKSGWTAGLKLVRGSIDEAIIKNCIKHKVGGDGPQVNAAKLRDARAVHKGKYVNTGDGDRDTAERGAWSKNFKKARGAGLIEGETTHGGEELVWIILEEEKD
jgi:hypothetical protein